MDSGGETPDWKREVCFVPSLVEKAALPEFTDFDAPERLAAFLLLSKSNSKRADKIFEIIRIGRIFLGFLIRKDQEARTMLIPIGHENMTVRRWPIVTVALIIINVSIFLATKSTLETEGLELEKLRVPILLLAASHPELKPPSEVQPLIVSFREKYPEEWAKIGGDKNRNLPDLWDARMQRVDDQQKLQKEMNALAEEYASFCDSSILQQYAFIPEHPNLISYLTANFLHGGWFHLIGNMWFLWLAGFVLEDVWGRGVYLASYILTGAAALQFYAWTNAGSIVPTLGASGAVAALMGAFLVRFPKIKIEMLWIYFIFRMRRFHASAYWLLTLWLLVEVLYGLLFGEKSGVAHWAHVGGFIFGALVALILRYSGIEHIIDTAIDKQLNPNADPEIRRAYECIDNKQLDKAIAVLQNYIAIRPMSLDAWNLLRDIYWQKQDYTAYHQATLKSFELHLKAHEEEAALCDYEDYMNSGGKQMPPSMRFDLCHLLESKGNLERAVDEYGKLAAEHPSEGQALLAQLAAGRVCLKKLNRPQDALRFYEAAEISPVPHLDYEQTIQSAIQDAKIALAMDAKSESGEIVKQTWTPEVRENVH
jgi:membrane associated rhomboid family serine protease